MRGRWRIIATSGSETEIGGDLMVLGPVLVRRFCLLVILAFAIVNSAASQIAGGLNETNATRLGGNSIVVGTVFWPSGKPVNTRIGLRLSSPTGGDFITTTDDRGQFVFSGLVAGNYTITIEGERDFEPVVQQVEVIQSRSASPESYSVMIRLRDKAPTNARPGVVSSVSARVPKHATEIYRKAVEIAKTGDHQGAIEQLKLSIAAYPEYAVALNELGVQYLRLNELEKAEEAFNSALKIEPLAAEPLVNRGIALFRLKRYADAEPLLRRAIESREHAAIAHYYLGRLFTNTERYDEAEKEFKAALAIDSKQMNEAHRMLANLFIVNGDAPRAVEELEIYLKLVPRAPDADNLRKVMNQLKSSMTPPPKTKPL